MSECECSLSNGTVSFRDVNGQTIMTFIRLCDGRYFGGRRHESIPFVPGSQMWITLGGIFDIIASLAREADENRAALYQMVSTSWDAQIKREMQASDIAKVLGCDADAVVNHFGQLVKIA